MTIPIHSTLATFAAVIVALGFAARMVRGLVRGERSRASGVLALALTLVAALEILDLLTMLNPMDMQAWRQAGLVVEGALAPAWVWFTALFARDYEEGRLPWTQRGLIALSALMPAWAGFLAATGAYFTPDFDTEQVLFLLPGSFYFYIALSLCCVAALVNIEATLAGAVHFRRWKIKFILLGAVCVLASQLLYFSQGLLYRSIDMRLAGLRSLALLLGALLMWYSDLRRGPEVRISFSRRMAIKSVVLAVTGLYLVGLGLMGEGVRILGEELGRAVLLGVSFLSGLGLVVVFLSDRLQRRIRLFLQLHFYGEKYDYRIQWAQFMDRLSSVRTQDELRQAALSACCETFGIVGAALFLYDHSSRAYVPVSLVEMDSREGVFGVESVLVSQLKSQRSVVRASDMAETSDWLEGAGFAIPLLREENLDGFVLLGPSINPQEEYDEEDFELMNTMARHISSALLNMRLTEQLARSREMEIMGKVSAFVVHDLKNHVYTLSLMVDNARKFIGNPEFQK
ncbi:MAG: PEP-CTERM system histidine kinase PrsK, partial [Desulfovibrionales bacterium]|nr:PEP-CTERM system histidine kinase PrsK [Desulfovibrionales bacterium]